MATYTDPTTIISTGKADPVQPGAVIFLIGSLLTVLVAIFFFLTITATKAKVADTRAEIVTSKEELAKLQPVADELTRLSDQATGLHSIFDNQRRWTFVLNKISERLHKDMAVTSIQMTDKGSAILNGVVNDYVTYAKVYQAFTDANGQKYFSSAKPTSVAKVEADGKETITFTFTLALQPFVLTAGSPQEQTAQ